jgi:GNAT superfamily N-acetyltransferase
MDLSIRQADAQDIETIADILREAARWLEDSGIAMWRHDELSPARIAGEIKSGLFFLAECEGESAGTIRYQLKDQLFWPDIPQQDSAFIHRLAVRRKFAGGEVSSALLLWAAARTLDLGRRYLRLDCETSRPHLRAIYERMGFQFHSNRQVGPYYVARFVYDVNSLFESTEDRLTIFWPSYFCMRAFANI